MVFIVLLRSVLLKMTSGDPLFSLTAIRCTFLVVVVQMCCFAGIDLASEIPVMCVLFISVVLIVLLFRMMPNSFRGRLVLVRTVVSRNVFSGALLSGPKMMVPFTTSVGVVP